VPFAQPDLVSVVVIGRHRPTLPQSRKSLPRRITIPSHWETWEDQQRFRSTQLASPRNSVCTRNADRATTSLRKAAGQPRFQPRVRWSVTPNPVATGTVAGGACFRFHTEGRPSRPTPGLGILPDVTHPGPPHRPAPAPASPRRLKSSPASNIGLDPCCRFMVRSPRFAVVQSAASPVPPVGALHDRPAKDLSHVGPCDSTAGCPALRPGIRPGADLGDSPLKAPFSGTCVPGHWACFRPCPTRNRLPLSQRARLCSQPVLRTAHSRPGPRDHAGDHRTQGTPAPHGCHLAPAGRRCGRRSALPG